MKKDTFIKSILDSTNTIKKVQPNDNLLAKIEAKINYYNETISRRKIWPIAASISILIAINAFFILKQKQVEQNSFSQPLVKVVSNQLYF